MATYEEAGVNIDLGDKCSAIAYEAAKGTFSGRKGMIGEPLVQEGGFSGALDMGDYYLVQNDDTVGTKIEIGEKIGKLDTIGYDLLAMVADDAICLGAEPVSVSNTLEVNVLKEEKVRALMSGLQKAALENKIVIPGGEIAELGNTVSCYHWGATIIGILEKGKMITGEKISAGDKLIGLRSAGFRSNGFSLVRYILKEKYGDEWYNEKYDETKTWGETVLTPSKIYSSAVLALHGRYKEKSLAELKGVVHVTGGGIYANTQRILKHAGLKAKFTDLPEPHEPMKKLMKLGNVSEEEAYKTWNMGVGMILISNDVEKIQEVCLEHEVKAKIIGEVV